MKKNFGTVAFTASVKREQEKWGSRGAYERVTEEGPDTDRFGPFEASFIGARDGFYLASVGQEGWPYVQYRGGKKGFLRVLDERTLAYADFRGNRQYISVGNVRQNERVCLFLMNYADQMRLKIYGRVEVVEGPEGKLLMAELQMPGEKALVERAMLIHLEAFDWNCPQHITPRYTVEEFAALRR